MLQRVNDTVAKHEAPLVPPFKKGGRSLGNGITNTRAIESRIIPAGRKSAMSFIELVDQVAQLLRQRGRISYRVLKREFGLDDEQA